MMRKRAKKTMALLLAVLMMISLIAPSIQADAKSKATKLESKKITMNVGNTKTINLLNNSKKVKWSTSNKKVLKITKKSKSYVKVKALKSGSAKITAKIGKKKYVCKVTVQADAKSKATRLKSKKMTMNVGSTQKISLLNNSKKVKWSTSNKKVLKITKKSKKYVKVKALKAGSAKVTAKIGKKKYVCKVTVQAKKRPSDPQQPSTEDITQPTTEDTQQPDAEDTKKPSTEDTTGTIGGEESSAQNYTRVKWIEMLLDAAGVQTITEEAVKKDSSGVPQYSYADTGEAEYALIVETAVREGILVSAEESDDKTFCPNQPATREFAAVTAVKLLGYLEGANALECNDLESLEYPLWDAVAVDIGLIGLQDGTFNGKAEVTGAEVKQILAKVKELKAGETVIPEKVVDIHYADDLIKDSISDLTDYLVTETETGYRIVINHDTDSIEETGIEEGKAIYLPADVYGKYKDGFVCRVAGIETSGQQLVVTCTPIESVFDVVKSFQLSGQSVAEKLILADGVTMKSADNAGIPEEPLSLASDDLQDEQLESKLSEIDGAVTLPVGAISLEKEIADHVTIGLSMQAPEIIYDIKCTQNTIEQFKVVASNKGTFSIKADASAESMQPNLQYEMFSIPLEVGGGFEITLLFSIQASISGNVSLTFDVTSDIGVELQENGKTIKPITRFGAEMGGGYAVTLSAGPELDIAFCWLSDNFLKVADINFGYGYEFDSSTSSGVNGEGRELFCRNNSLRSYLYIGMGNVEESLLNRLGISFKRTYNPKVYTDVHMESFNNFTSFTQVKECTAVNSTLYGTVLDKYGNAVDFDKVIVSDSTNPARKFLAESGKKGEYKCKVPSGDYTVTAVWDGMIRDRIFVTVSDADRQCNIKERDDIIGSGFGKGFSWFFCIAGGMNYFDCEIDESADIAELKKVIDKYRSVVGGSIEKVCMYGIVGEESLEGLFSDCTHVSIMDLDGLNTEKAVNMSKMFYNCSDLINLYLDDLDTSNVTNMSSMFEGCTALKQLRIGNFDTGNVEDMSSMFNSCQKLREIDVKGFNTGKVTNMDSMFNYCYELAELDVSGFDTSKVVNMANMFYYCRGLTELNVSNFNTSAVTNIGGLFAGCSKLTALDVSSFDTSAVTNMAFVFSDCSNLTALDLSNFNTGAVTNMENMFRNCSALTVLDLSNFNTSAVIYMDGMFRGCSNLSELNISSFDISNVKRKSDMFDNCKEEIIPSWYSSK